MEQKNEESFDRAAEVLRMHHYDLQVYFHSLRQHWPMDTICMKENNKAGIGMNNKPSLLRNILISLRTKKGNPRLLSLSFSTVSNTSFHPFLEALLISVLFYLYSAASIITYSNVLL